MHFLRFRPWVLFICERSAENETMQFGFGFGLGSVLDPFRCICEMAYSADSIITEIVFSQCKRAMTQKISKPELQF